VSTANKFTEVQKDLLATEQELEKMQKKKEKERKELAQIKDEKRSKANELDELKSKYLLWLAAIQVLVDSYKLGFTLNIVKGIIEELHKLSIKAQPIRSAHRVLERMRKVTTEIELDKAITAKKTQLSTLEKEYISLMASIKTLKKDVIGTFSKVEKKAVNSIESISQTGKESLSGLITSVKQVEAQSINSIRCVNDEAEKSLTKHQTDVGYFFINNSNAVQLAIDLFGNQISEYCDLREEIGEMKPWIDLATILFGTYQDPKQLRRVNLNVLLKLTEGIHLYTVTRWPYERVKVPGDVSDRDFGILTGSELNLTSLSTLLLEGLRTLKWKGEV
jgi:cell division protein FtsB